jgi:biopolymer transport protein ExbB
MNLILDIFAKGGPVMYPLLLCSVLALAIIIEKLVNLRLSRVVRPETLRTLAVLIERGDIEGAAGYCGTNPGVFSGIILQGLQHHALGREEVKEAILDAGRHAVPRLERYLGVLGTLTAVSPLLGLLGTVTGMIKVFTVISHVGVGRADALAGGIAEALITTVAGLVIAIPSLVMYNLFRDRAEAIIVEMERHSLEIIRRLFGSSAGADRGAAPGAR